MEEKIPAPITAPIASMMRSPGPSTRLRPFGSSPSAISSAMGFRANSDRIISGGIKVYPGALTGHRGRIVRRKRQAPTSGDNTLHPHGVEGPPHERDRDHEEDRRQNVSQ